MQNIETPVSSSNKPKILDRLQQKIHKIASVYKLRFYNDMVNFSRKLETKFGRKECREYKAFHWLIGSTPSETCVKKDLPGNLVNRFIASCETVYPMVDAVSKRVHEIIAIKKPPVLAHQGNTI